jgi:adenylate kinase
MSELENRSIQHWLLDGFPKTSVQVVACDKICDVDLVNSLNIPFKTKIDSADAKFLVEESFT